MFSTALGKIICGDSKRVLKEVPDDSVDLLLTSPPYALQDKKAYGNPGPEQYIEWLLQFVPDFRRVIKPTGSIVINIGGAWNPMKPTRSIYQYKLLIKLVEECQLYLAQEFYWFIPGRMTTTEYASRRKIRVRDAVEHIYWLSKTENPKADVTKILVAYSESYKKFLSQDQGAKDAVHTKSFSGLEVHGKNLVDNGGRIPYNMLYISSVESGDPYFDRCEKAGVTPHPARFPKEFVKYFLNFLTDVNDVVLDPFGGSCTTGFVAEQLQRRWTCIELEPEYIQGGILRFGEPGTHTSRTQQGLF